MSEQGSIQQALEVLGDMFDSMSPSHQRELKRMQKMNERFKRFPSLFPKYVIDDRGNKPKVTNLKEEFPNVEYFQFGFQRGYQYIFDNNGYPLMMCMHGIFDKLEDAEEQLDYLINTIRKERYNDTNF